MFPTAPSVLLRRLHASVLETPRRGPRGGCSGDCLGGRLAADERSERDVGDVVGELREPARAAGEDVVVQQLEDSSHDHLAHDPDRWFNGTATTELHVE